jgi:radical SAM superfamily enzyme YgiQ (UPF0313 family)
MKIALIWPQGFTPHYSLPLPFGFLKSNLNSPGVDIQLIDCVMENITAESSDLRGRLEMFNPDVVGVSSMSSMSNEALKILKIAKQINPEVKTIIGGSHATCYSREVLETDGMDFLLRGEGEVAFDKFINYVIEGRSDWGSIEGLCYKNNQGDIVIKDAARNQNLDELSIPDYDFINIDRLIEKGYKYSSSKPRNAPILATRGCPYRCDYCSAPLMNGRVIRRHSVDYLVEWVKRLYYDHSIRWINIIDDNFTYDPEYVSEFCSEIIRLELHDLSFGTPNGIRMQRGNLETWRIMKRAGWRFLVVAPESGSKKVLRQMKKGINLDKVPGIVADIKKAGLYVAAFIILGYPGETLDDLKETRKFVKKCKFDIVYFNNFQPLPGTPVHQRLLEQGELGSSYTPKNYSDSVHNYCPKELEGFNFSRFIMLMYTDIIIANPRSLWFLLKQYNFHLIFKKLKSIIQRSLAGKIKKNTDEL